MRDSAIEGLQRMLAADFQSNAMRSLRLVASETQREPAPAEPTPTRLARGLAFGLAFGLLVPVSSAILLAFALGGI